MKKTYANPTPRGNNGKRRFLLLLKKRRRSGSSPPNGYFQILGVFWELAQERGKKRKRASESSRVNTAKKAKKRVGVHDAPVNNPGFFH